VKISQRVFVLVAFSSAGLVAVSSTAYYGVTSIRSVLDGLTAQATPLQNKTYEVQEHTERMLGALLRLSLVEDANNAAPMIASVEAELRVLERLQGEIRDLDPSHATDLSAFRAAQTQIVSSVNQRLSDETAYETQSTSARNALQTAEAAVSEIRATVAGIESEAGHAADKAQEASIRLGETIKHAMFVSNKLKDLVLLVYDTDAAANRFRLAPLRERLKAALDSIDRIASTPGEEEALREVRVTAGSLLEAFGREGSGLFALRSAVLSKSTEAEATYAAQHKQILAQIEEQSTKLLGLIDTLEEQLVKRRQVLEASLKLRNEPGGVVASSQTASLLIRDMVGELRSLMLAANDEEARSATKRLDKLGEQLLLNIGSMRSDLIRMGRNSLAAQVDAASNAMRTVTMAVARVSQTKRGLLQSEAGMREALSRLKETASRLTRAGDQQVQSISDRQSEITRQVAERVHTSLVLIIGISAAVIALALLVGLRTVRLIRHRMTEAVAVAEAVSRGELKHVTLHRDNDETGRLLAALELMVNTLTEIVRHIRNASDAINAGSASISDGNSELQAHAEQQAGSLQQTAASMEQLTSTVRQSVSSAQQANELAHSAREAASGGGRAVGEIVATMHEIQESSRQIGEIITVIDGISFQTNILALNAAVEAARAGAQGRGFAVVASEVRSLAQRSAVAAQEIKSLITSSVQKVNSGSALVERAGARIGEMVSQVVQVTDLIAEISRASNEQFHSLSEVNQTVKSLDDLTQRNAALAQRGTASASVLCEQAKGLNDAVSRFKIDLPVAMPTEDEGDRRAQIRKKGKVAAVT